MADFHFLRPYWFIAILPALISLWALRHYKVKQSGWQKLIPSHLAKHVLVGEDKAGALPIWLIASVWLVIITALAGPTWEKRPQPVYQIESGKVILFDLSLSMRAEDIKPNRLTMARFKAIEIARKIQEGDLGLIGYAGDAFTLSPLTPDNNNIISLLPNLSPELMPVLGSDAELAVSKSIELLQNAGYLQGEIFWLTDGIESNEANRISKLLAGTQYKLLILGVGTDTGAPIKLTSGELLKDNSGGIVIPKLNSQLLVNLANTSKGVFQAITPDDTDINNLISQVEKSEQIKKQESEEQAAFGDQWLESGPWLVILILPFAAYAFRRGLVYLGLITLGFSLQPQKVEASILENIWQTADQRAQQALKSEDYQSAESIAASQRLKAAAQFKQGNYEAAVESYKGLNDADSLYNKANALANLGKLDEAIEAFDQALAQRPDFAPAQQNKQLAEQLKQQQENQKNQQNGDQNNSDQQNSEQQNSDQKNSEQQNSSQDQQSSDQNNQQKSGEQNQQNSSQQNSDQQQQNAEQQNQSSEESQSQQTEQEERQRQAQAQREKDKEAERQAQQQATQAEQQEAEQNADQEEAQQQVAQARELTEEERQAQEEQQVIQQLLNKVEDDPSYLLRRKMQLEYKKRRHSQPPTGVTKSW